MKTETFYLMFAPKDNPKMLRWISIASICICMMVVSNFLFSSPQNSESDIVLSTSEGLLLLLNIAGIVAIFFKDKSEEESSSSFYALLSPFPVRATAFIEITEKEIRYCLQPHDPVSSITIDNIYKIELGHMCAIIDTTSNDRIKLPFSDLMYELGYKDVQRIKASFSNLQKRILHNSKQVA